MGYRNFLQGVIYNVIDPFVRLLLRAGFTPNTITFVGFGGNIIATMLFIMPLIAPLYTFVWVGCGGGVLLAAGLFDMLDGRLARVGNLSSRFGAFCDSTLDRYSELLSLGGVAACFFIYGSILWGIVTLLAMIGSIMVSYVRARAEGIGLDCKVGLLQRPERVVLLAVGAIVSGCIAHILPLCLVVAVIAVLSNYTAFLRVAHVHRLLKG